MQKGKRKKNIPPSASAKFPSNKQLEMSADSTLARIVPSGPERIVLINYITLLQPQHIPFFEKVLLCTLKIITIKEINDKIISF